MWAYKTVHRSENSGRHTGRPRAASLGQAGGRSTEGSGRITQRQPRAKPKGPRRLRTGRTQLHHRDARGPAGGFQSARGSHRRPKGPLRPRCCRCLGRCHTPPTRGGPAPAGSGRAQPWPAPPSGPTRGRAPAPRSRAAPRAPARSCGTAGAAPSPASPAGPADSCQEKRVGGEQGGGRTEGQTQMESQRERTGVEGGRKRQRNRDRRPQKGGGPGVPPHLTSRTFFSVTSTWMTMG